MRRSTPANGAVVQPIVDDWILCTTVMEARALTISPDVAAAATDRTPNTELNERSASVIITAARSTQRSANQGEMSAVFRRQITRSNYRVDASNPADP